MWWILALVVIGIGVLIGIIGGVFLTQTSAASLGFVVMIGSVLAGVLAAVLTRLVLESVAVLFRIVLESVAVLFRIADNTSAMARQRS